MKEVVRYFPSVTKHQIEQFDALIPLYTEWNEKINVISRKDIENFEVRHVLHSLAPARIWSPNSGDRVLDIGTGGGFPGIPLAIFFPEVKFHLVDSIGKKIKVVNEVSQALGLTNVVAEHARVETLNSKYHMIVSRAVAQTIELQNWTRKLINPKGKSGNLQSGWLLLKGGDLTEELNNSDGFYTSFDLNDWFDDPFFETKKLIHVVM